MPSRSGSSTGSPPGHRTPHPDRHRRPAVDAAQTQTPKKLELWLLRLVVQLEPFAFEQRHRKALAERGVRVVQGADGMGYVTGEVSAADAAAIDARLAAAARSLGADDPRTDQQRRADLFADILLGRVVWDDEGTTRTTMRARAVEGQAMPRASLSKGRTTADRPGRAGWRSRTSTPTPANCSAPAGNASTRTANLSATRPPVTLAAKPQPRRRGPMRPPRDHPDRDRRAAVQPARPGRPPPNWPTDPA